MILKTRGKVPGIDQAAFEKIAEQAKESASSAAPSAASTR